MINPPKLEELEFTFRCRIATYDKHDIAEQHTTISDLIRDCLKSRIGSNGIVSNAESRMEQL